MKFAHKKTVHAICFHSILYSSGLFYRKLLMTKDCLLNCACAANEKP